MGDLTQEEVFANDEDPMEALAKMEREENSATDADTEGEVNGEVAAVADDLGDGDLGGVDTSGQDAEVEPEVEPEGEVEEPGEPKPEAEGETGKEEVAEAESGNRVFSANGQKFEFSQEEINAQFEGVFGKAMDYTQKMQKIAPYRKMISALEEEKVSQEDLNVALDALKGDKGALKSLMEKSGVDAFDLDTKSEEAPYEAKDYGKTEFQQEMQSITEAISKDKEYPVTVNVIDKEWDTSSRDLLADNPSMISGLHQDIKSGVYDKVAPLAAKMKVLDGNTKSDLEYYILAGEQAFPQQDASAQPAPEKVPATQDAGQKFDKASSEAGKRRAASSTRARADTRGVIDYLDDDDTKYDEWYKKLNESQ
jgi:hypothetical protein